MAKGNSAPARSDKVDVTDFGQAAALAAGWRGVFEFFGGRVDSWEIVEPSEENPDGGLIARGFSVNSDYDPNQILSDIGKRDRRLPFFPTYLYVERGVEPLPFDDPQDMTNWMVGFLKGSVEDGTSKTPEYVRNAVAQYKAAHGMATRRGPKRKIIRLDDVNSIDEAAVKNADPEVLARLLKLAGEIANQPSANEAVGATEATASAS